MDWKIKNYFSYDVKREEMYLEKSCLTIDMGSNLSLLLLYNKPYKPTSILSGDGVLLKNGRPEERA